MAFRILKSGFVTVCDTAIAMLPAEVERDEVAQQVVSDLLRICAKHDTHARELARILLRNAKKMVRDTSTRGADRHKV